MKTQDPKSSRSNKNTKEDERIIYIPSQIILFGLLFCAICLAVVIVYLQKQKDLDQLQTRINKLMSNKSAISDYTLENTDGTLHKVYFSNMLLGNEGEKNMVGFDKKILAVKPYYDPSISQETEVYKESLKKWNFFKELKEYYQSEPYTGFTVKRLEKNDDLSFSSTYMWSGDMAYKVLSSTHYEGTDYGYFSTPGYDIPTYRPSLKKCYEGAATFLTIEKKDKSYLEGSYKKISSIENIESKFFEVKQQFPKYSFWNDTIFVEQDKTGIRSHIINNSKITKQTSSDDAYVFTSQWVVWYKSYTNTFSIKPKEWAFITQAFIYSLVSCSIITLIYFGVKYRNRIKFN